MFLLLSVAAQFYKYTSYVMKHLCIARNSCFWDCPYYK